MRQNNFQTGEINVRYEQFMEDAQIEWDKLKEQEPEVTFNEMLVEEGTLLAKVLEKYEGSPTSYILNICSSTKMQFNMSLKLDKEADQYHYFLFYVLGREIEFRKKEGDSNG